ncbi:MAG: hypothetical protein ACREYC_10595, partial [Gammaproteobacteria bacterium]
MTPLESMALWQRTLAPQGDLLDARREVLREALRGFRERVAQLVQTLGAELPGLTVHDITHLDALWRVADQIAGPDYSINPAIRARRRLSAARCGTCDGSLSGRDFVDQADRAVARSD